VSATELSRDDAEPPSRHLIDLSLVVADDLRSAATPSQSQLLDWVSTTLAQAANDTNAVTGISRFNLGGAQSTSLRFEVAVSVIDAAAIQSLNHQYRDKNAATNVLSFPSGMPQLPANDIGEVHTILGDIVLCQPVILAEAAEQAKPPQHHWAHMVVHSVLHLLGYDHDEVDAAAHMEALEVAVLSDIYVPNPYQLPFEKT